MSARGFVRVAATLLSARCLGPIKPTGSGDRGRAPLIFGFVFMTFNAVGAPAYAGFCFSEFRFVEPDEYLQSAVLEAARFSQPKIALETLDDAREYIMQHPDCCQLLSHEEPLADSGFLARVAGLAGETAQVILPTDLTSIAGVPLAYHSYVSLDRCAKPVDRIGMEMPVARGLD